ncbi:hypothetical protein BT63DRAFT_417453 [Microthyrium microscopicum]|uniref:Uncharacterized protein n=1 Tax=Microthyrium microscopicum TaxID=703497 RepID=A0A6A6U1B0_9PEZI|nr:hypothetical protein BT63DRAFT_417453 [Microthyrium microscopicum]
MARTTTVAAVEATLISEYGMIAIFEQSIVEFLNCAENTPIWHVSVKFIDALQRIVRMTLDPQSSRFNNNVLLKLYDSPTSDITVIQSELNDLLQYVPNVRKHFAGFLSAPTKSKTHKNAARRYLCELTGLPFEFNEKAPTLSWTPTKKLSQA